MKRAGARLRLTVDEFTSDRQVIVNAIRSASLVLMPSREEGFGLTGLEAISEGVPVLLSRTSGLARAIEQRLPSLAPAHIFEVEDDLDVTARRIRDLLVDPDAAFQRAKGLRDAMRLVFDWDRSAREMLRALYELPLGATSTPGIPPPSKSTSTAITDVFGATSAHLLAWRQTLSANNEWIERPELQRIFEHARDKDQRALVLLGAPGSGKSALLAKATTQLSSEGVSVLAIKADRLGQDIDSSTKLGEELGLPTDVASALRASARLNRTVLIIDQLDTLADISDQQTQRLSVLLALVDEVMRAGLIPVIMSCRTFEFAHDVRLQRLEADVLRLAPPAREEVERVLKASGLEPTRLPPRLCDLFDNVHALDLFLRLKDVAASTLMETHQQLLDLLWKEKIGTGPGAPELEKAARRIALLMSKREEVWLSRALIADEGLEHAVDALRDRGLLVEEQRRIAFSHQTLFDFARARAFLAEEPLARYVREKQDALFVRPVLGTGLAYLREADPATYIEELESLCLDPGIRRHVQSLLVQFVGQVKDPTKCEIALLVKRIGDPIWVSVAIDSIVGRERWFEILRATYLPPLLRAPNAGMAAELLLNAFRFAADDVLALLTENWARDPAKHGLLAWVLSYLDSWPEQARTLALNLVGAGSLDRSATGILMRNAIHVAADFAPRLIAAELGRRRGAIAGADMARGYKELLEWAARLDYLAEAAAEAPRAFIHSVWPWFVDLVEHIVSDGRRTRYAEDYTLGTSLRLSAYELPRALREALTSWARQDPMDVAGFVAVWADRDSVAIHRFLVLALEAALPAAASAALSYLLGDPRRLNVGDSSPSDGYSIRLIKALGPLLFGSRPGTPRGGRAQVADHRPDRSRRRKAGGRGLLERVASRPPAACDRNRAPLRRESGADQRGRGATSRHRRE